MFSVQVMFRYLDLIPAGYLCIPLQIRNRQQNEPQTVLGLTPLQVQKGNQ